MKHADLRKVFPIVSLSREDLLEAGIPRETVERLDDSAMYAIAAAMQDAYVFGPFEESLTQQVERYLVKRHEGSVVPDTTAESQVENNPRKMNATECLHALIRQVEELPEILGSAEDIMIDDEAMTLLNTSIEDMITQVRRSLQEVVDASAKLTEYLASHIAADAEASRQVRSLINETGYEEHAVDRLREWVEAHMSVLMSPLLVRNPYPSDWLDWMQQVIPLGLDQVDWNDLVVRLRQALSLTLE